MSHIEQILDQLGVRVQPLEVLARTAWEEVHALWVPGNRALAVWRRLRDLVGQTGHWPAILGDEESASMVARAIEERSATAERGTIAERGGIAERGASLPAEKLVSRGLGLDPRQWFWSRPEMDPEAFECEEGEWEGPGARSQFSLSYDLTTGTSLEKVAVALVPARSGWEVPAFLRMGGWNYCPEPHEHVCILRYWEQFYGAEVVGVSFDTLEMQVALPPIDKESALELARQHFVYCPDTVQQGADTLQRLAGLLLDSHVWSFWWD
jgi:hypothetical protein